MKRIFIVFLLTLLYVGTQAQEVRDTVIVTDSWKYEGQWPEGEGVLYHQYNGLYWGSFKEAIPVCCKYCDFYGNRYYGNFNEWAFDGYGIYFLQSGLIYDGQFSDNSRTGVAKLYTLVSLQNGEFLDGNIIEGREFHFTKEKLEAMKPVFPEKEMSSDMKAFVNKGIKNTSEPKFQGEDIKAFSIWVEKNLKSIENVYGEVVVSCVIDERGEVSEVSIVENSEFDELDREVLRVISKAPKFKPAEINGHKVSRQCTVPVCVKPVETPPTFMGKDMNAFSMWVNKQMQERTETRENADGQIRKIVVGFTIDADGNLCNLNVINSEVSPEFERHLLEVLATAPKFGPATQNGKNISVSLALPVLEK
jgi:TonB family protein